jgi:hypothetical protein
MSETLWRSSMPCPKCQADGGRPWAVESRTTVKVIVLLRCGACDHHWTMERDTPLLTPRAPPEESA